jgi:hypothetical protein
MIAVYAVFGLFSWKQLKLKELHMPHIIQRQHCRSLNINWFCEAIWLASLQPCFTISKCTFQGDLQRGLPCKSICPPEMCWPSGRRRCCRSTKSFVECGPTACVCLVICLNCYMSRKSKWWMSAAISEVQGQWNRCFVKRDFRWSDCAIPFSFSPEVITKPLVYIYVWCR